MRSVRFFLIALILSACTPAQIATFEWLTGSTVSEDDRDILLRLPNEPFRLPDGRVIEVDGTVIQPVAPSGSRCPQFFDDALTAGWRLSDWRQIDRIMFRESRCDHTVYNGRNRDRSYGLMQINTKGGLWGEVQWRCGLSSKDQLFDPVVNLSCAKALHRAYGWRPWRV